MEENNISVDSDGANDGEEPAAGDYVAPGVPIVRSSTPRPLPFLLAAKTELPLAPSTAAAEFPAEAPDAPPLPEEPVKQTNTLEELTPDQTPEPEPASSDAEQAAREPVNEFVWLFEYALDMDPMRLNRPERLDGSAFAYGPAMLKGYRLVFEGLDARNTQVLASLTEARNQPEAEVWGVLYRVPLRSTRGDAGEMPLLDKAHYAETFVPVEVLVREPYRQREVTCVTYVASEATRQQVSQLPPEKRLPEPDYFKRLLQVARRQRLPASYLRTLEELVPPTIPAASPLPTTPPDQDTEPLPALAINQSIVPKTPPARASEPVEAELLAPEKQSERWSYPWEAAYPAGLERWLTTFALYISLLLFCVLVLAVFQGLNFWPTVFNNAFAPLGIPWYVLVYGVLGACISCVISLARPVRTYPPAFVVLTWFTRPFLGAVLGSFAYLVLNSGVVLVSVQPAQHFALCSVVGGLAGLCEGKLFFRYTARRFF